MSLLSPTSDQTIPDGEAMATGPASPLSLTKTVPSKFNAMDPSLLFSPSVKAKTLSTGRSVDNVKTTAGLPIRPPLAAGISTKSLTQARQLEQGNAKKPLPQKLAVGRRMLSPSTPAAGKLRSQPLDPLGKSSAKGTGTSVTVVRRMVKVPVPRPTRPQTVRTSISPDVMETSSEPSSDKKSKSKKSNGTTAHRREGSATGSTSAQPSANSAKLVPKGTKGSATKGPSAASRGDVSRSKIAARPVKRKLKADME